MTRVFTRALFIEAIILCAVQILVYSTVCFSYRSLAQANIPMTVGVDVFYSALQFTVIRRVAQATNAILPMIGYTIGSAFGTYLGIVASLLILGK